MSLVLKAKNPKPHYSNHEIISENDKPNMLDASPLHIVDQSFPFMVFPFCNHFCSHPLFHSIP